MSEKKQPDIEIKPTREELLVHIGKSLHEARESGGLSKEKIAQNLKLRLSYIQALESGNWSELPEAVYALGFLRQYAKFLGIDIDHEITLLKSDEYKLTKPLTFPDPPIAPNKSWVIVAALLFVFLIVIFNIFWNAGDHPKETSTSHPTASEQPLAPLPVPENITTDLSYNSAAQQQTPEPETNNNQAELVQTEPVQTNSNTSSPVAATPESADTSIKATSNTFVFKAIQGDIWLEVYASEDATAPLRQDLIKKGGQLAVETPESAVWMTSGNSTMLEVIANGVTVIEPGDFKRNVVKRRQINLAE
ncbi:MAG: hypothetical protein CO186_01940 [Zetaproteobacteria bacterium CG_4_9_14_3_um_filter_49_83]|nr:MAG: hypothetical protein AUJ56_01905 [Zetaproteobacteria bacterium CG1_02_49_23]PIQ34864.1 MAG: hypothetical protein COW62_00430 [Zetaproteobacteria bacterium CG17_big_fil_post_rev_8_21_14_2_50_50_13]PIV31176.1 MAG: hypothetical protein COS35_02695 [Zetaproteobacteria bacterium CG02_land_8_20_14_3_00_50_9]PIY55812.1 MAG: hypothetical protein COZ00_07640 [Zetaproteobacteria bacterium CG_4_10_14_0_8_um_filter_49_80]PJA36194.1 MAG: hypothetical protein CO186_01940 [Zetaproteobacteria bacterium